MDTACSLRSTTASRAAAWDGVFVTLSAGHAAALCLVPSAPLIAVGLWWNANTISHNFIHRPFFRTRRVNSVYSVFLSLVLGVPQSLWRHRHLAHHAAATSEGTPRRTGPRRGRPLPRRLVLVEMLYLGGLWAGLAMFAPAFLHTVYLPGWLAGLGLCFLQGHFEHARGTTSHYGRAYNLLFFNDGYHVEHHRSPATHWADLPALAGGRAPVSRWPAVLRWLDWCTLESVERAVLASPGLQRFVLRAHARAFRALLPAAGDVRRITIVGGGLFPRTALILRQLVPEATLTVVDANPAHLDIARRWLDDHVILRHTRYDPDAPDDADLVVIPLSFQGDLQRVCDRPPAPAVIVHDWLGRRRGCGARVSWLLLKRLNLVRR